MTDQLISDDDALAEFCEHVRHAGIVAFDTEFVSEYTYRPELCLLQFATADRTVAVDPYQVRNLDRWWDIMCDEDVTVVVHGGREEVHFCLTQSQRPPRRFVDIQIAEGLRSRSYPVSYPNLVHRVLGHTIHGGETRTDWRRRPLSDRQIDYALEDVQYVLQIWDDQHNSLVKWQRLHWAEAEFQRLIDNARSELTQEKWQRLSGIQKLNPRGLAVARELAQWREQEAERRNCPARRVLRDDLLLDLARRKPRSTKEVLATRDMNRSAQRRIAPELMRCVSRAMSLPSADLPESSARTSANRTHDEDLLAKLLGLALANRCAEMNVATSLVGTNADLKHLVRSHVYGEHDGPPPRLTEGWRAELCGDLLTDVLDGRITLRVALPDSDRPLVFERSESNA